MFCDNAAGADGGPRARPQWGDTPAQQWEHITADHDVIGALTERDIDRDGIGTFQRRGHRVTSNVSEGGVSDAAPAPSPHKRARRASMHSSTIFSCGTSRDQIVKLACR